ncbi:MAG: hypothetical protein O2782_18935 [bacterium]|nr:hypothetical protein [bacterium]
MGKLSQRLSSPPGQLTRQLTNTAPPAFTPTLLERNPAVAFLPPPEGLSPQDRYLLEYHRRNLRNGTYLDDQQGMTTVNIMGVTGPDGRIYNVPGYADGKRLNEQEATTLAAQLGWEKFPSFDMEFDGPIEQHPANVSARSLHDLIDQDGNAFRIRRALDDKRSFRLGSP